MGAALADSAVSYGLAIRPYALTLIELDQLVVGLEGTVVVGGFCPGNADGARNVSAALGRLRHPWRSNHFAGELVRRPHVDEVRILLVQDLEDQLTVSPDVLVRLACLIAGRCDLGNLGRERPSLELPLLTSSVHQPRVLVAKVLELPQGVGREPVVVVTVEDHGGIARDARL